MRPFFTFYGGKWRIAPKYPEPRYDTIVEPFAGSGGYSVRHNGRDVRLYDIDEKIVGTWQYLITTPADEIRQLPLCDGTWESVDDLALCQEARWLIGWWLNKGSQSPVKRPSAWLRSGKYGGASVWGPEVRSRIADQVDGIRHWSVEQASYHKIDQRPATWFIDPPYANAGRYYRHGSADIDYAHLAGWCASLSGQVMACENVGANWLPFEPFIMSKANNSQLRNRSAAATSAEAIWLNDTLEAVA